MAEPPQPKPEQRWATEAELEKLYAENKFDELLATCDERVICDGAPRPEDTKHASLLKHVRGVKYIHREFKYPIAVIFTYTYEPPDGRTLRKIRMLRVGNVKWDIYPKPR